MIKHTPQERAAAHTAKLHHKQFVRTQPKRAHEEQEAALRQILDSETPEWGSLTIKVGTFVKN